MSLRPGHRPSPLIPRRSPPMSQPDFTVEVSQNEYLPEGGDDVNAIVTVTSPDTASSGTGPAPAPDAGIAEIVIIDCSGARRSPQTKIAKARAAPAPGGS